MSRTDLVKRLNTEIFLLSGVGAGIFWFLTQEHRLTVTNIGSSKTNISISLTNRNNPTLSQTLNNDNSVTNTNNDGDTINQSSSNTNTNNRK